MAGTTPPRITQQPGTTYGLKDLLLQWGVQSSLEMDGMSDLWECQLVPSAATAADAVHHTSNMMPFFAPASHAERVFAACGADGLEFVSDPKWNAFPRPKIAFVGGWGQPGSDMADVDSFRLVKSFREVIDSSDKLNLQMFHREGPEQPGLPVLPDLLDWPLPEVLKAQEEGGPGVVCDNATRVSKRGALTWWHLDDGGEFVFQVALPLRGAPVLIGPRGKPVVKLFIFAPADAYDFILQDKQSNKSDIVAGLHLFEAATQSLPSGAAVHAGGDASAATRGVLPRLLVAPLEAGEQPLLSMPNLPHLVLTVQDCVMVEQRRISTYFMDEVHYWLERARRWADAPVMYPFLQDVVTSETEMARQVVVPLLAAARRAAKAAADEATEADASAAAAAVSIEAWAAARAVASLECVAANRKFFSLTPTSLDAIRKVVRECSKELVSTRTSSLRNAVLQMRQVSMGEARARSNTGARAATPTCPAWLVPPGVAWASLRHHRKPPCCGARQQLSPHPRIPWLPLSAA